MADIEDIFDETEMDDGDQEVKRRGKDDADKVPDGAYNAKIVEFSVFAKELDNGDRDYFTVFWFEVTGGAASGAQLQSFSAVGPNSIKFIKKAIKTVTGRIPKWSDMYDKDTGRTGKVLFDLVGKHVQVTQKTKGKYANLYIDKVIHFDEPVQPVDNDEDGGVDDLF